MPAPKRLDPTRDLAQLYGWLVRQHRGKLPQERLALRLAEALGRSVSGSLVGKWETGAELVTAEAAVALDREFGTDGLFTYLQVHLAREVQAGGTITWNQSDGQEVSGVPTRRKVLDWLRKGATAGVADRLLAALGSDAIDAIEANRRAGATSLAPGTVERLGQLTEHYQRAYGASSPNVLHAELLVMRLYVGSLLDRKLTLTEHRDLVVLTGLLSALLGLASFDCGDRAAALAWCDDAKERGTEAGHPAIVAWSYEPRVLVAYYGGQPKEAVVAAQAGRRSARCGTVAHARLALQEMRAVARTCDASAATEARGRAEHALAKLPAKAPRSGTFLGVDERTLPAFTVMAHLDLGQHGDAEQLAGQLLDTCDFTDWPTGYALRRLDRGIARAQLGRLDEAIGDGMQALDTRRLASSVVARAGELDATLQRGFPGAVEARDFHERYVLARQALAAPTGGA